MEAAHIDGASEVKTMLSVDIPMGKPMGATMAMLVGIACWNDWNNGCIYLLKRTALYSIQNLLNRLMQNIQMLSINAQQVSNATEGLAQIPQGTVRMAMAVLGVLPVMMIYPVIQRNFVRGITLGGVKG